MPKITTGISLDSDFFAEAKTKAKKHRRTFSNYVEGLIVDDLVKDSVITNKPHDTPKTSLKRRVREVI